MTGQPTIRIRILSTHGSAPREAGTEMIVSATGISGTIGGGRLEFDAVGRARQMIVTGEAAAEISVTLGPGSGQCCGGRVRLSLDRAAPSAPEPRPVVLIFGAGHVGRALAQIMRDLPFSVELLDERPDQLALAPAGITARLTTLPEAAIRAAPPAAAYVIATHDHGLDFLLVAEALRRNDATYTGMIGSATKRARLEHALRAQGLDPAGLTCPIGAGQIRDKRPEIIALFTAAEIARSFAPMPALD
ncbi:MAG: xanthine dehydrogenase accessory protein XdhC [Paracoccus sp. (in: a-proteobacteria)]|nr:xanthine dehydrogenase accessory protein XdhC [Paracoccus sp. (in: a-proteobacteria)]